MQDQEQEQKQKKKTLLFSKYSLNYREGLDNGLPGPAEEERSINAGKQAVRDWNGAFKEYFIGDKSVAEIKNTQDFKSCIGISILDNEAYSGKSITDLQKSLPTKDHRLYLRVLEDEKKIEVYFNGKIKELTKDDFEHMQEILKEENFDQDLVKSACGPLNFKDVDELAEFFEAHLFHNVKEKHKRSELVRQALLNFHQMGFPHASNYLIQVSNSRNLSADTGSLIEPKVKIVYRPTETGVLIEEENVYRSMVINGNLEKLEGEPYYAKTNAKKSFEIGADGVVSAKVTEVTVDCRDDRLNPVFDPVSVQLKACVAQVKETIGTIISLMEDDLTDERYATIAQALMDYQEKVAVLNKLDREEKGIVGDQANAGLGELDVLDELIKNDKGDIKTWLHGKNIENFLEKVRNYVTLKYVENLSETEALRNKPANELTEKEKEAIDKGDVLFVQKTMLDNIFTHLPEGDAQKELAKLKAFLSETLELEHAVSPAEKEVIKKLLDEIKLEKGRDDYLAQLKQFVTKNNDDPNFNVYYEKFLNQEKDISEKAQEVRELIKICGKYLSSLKTYRYSDLEEPKRGPDGQVEIGPNGEELRKRKEDVYSRAQLIKTDAAVELMERLIKDLEQEYVSPLDKVAKFKNEFKMEPDQSVQQKEKVKENNEKLSEAYGGKSFLRKILEFFGLVRKDMSTSLFFKKVNDALLSPEEKKAKEFRQNMDSLHFVNRR